ncbi:DinB family protein [Streptomyces sp. NPDC002012]|uniref:DinB family protein n=1 Tax=Streptomyces sp. NPDC002012 TaxID=3154532 RepID=UPI00331F2209
MTKRVPLNGSEKESLRASLDRHRDVVRWKIYGLDDEALRQPMTPSGTNLLGLLKHLATVEYGYFCTTFGRETEPLWFDPYTEDMQVAAHESTEDIVEFYDRACTAADKTISELSLSTLGTSWNGNTVSMRWALIHMIEDTVRHAGHMDILRELIDGATGDHPPA